MKAAELAALHARAMEHSAPWSAEEFEDLIRTDGVFLVFPSTPKYFGGARGGNAPSHDATPEAAQNLSGFALGRVILDEVELLTLAIDPSHRRQSIGRACLQDFEAEAMRKGAIIAHLEVAATNTPAIALYRAAGWEETGLRKDYYKTADARIDAVLMAKRIGTP